ncbi:IS630 transposase-related protein [Synechocystis sp. PCC 6714]|uniref:IS630 transposase-related protein n=2 Tax=unclassified Synechocystis TaxID=2640012 RepID=UPI00056FC032|nr:IS630 transposase-related protein [Synechocystis sp. PCC 6714]
MAYDLDLRLRVISFLEEGNGVTKASKIFRVGRETIYRWLSRENLEPTKVKNRRRKIDIKELEKDVMENPDMPMKERAKKFGVTASALSYRFKEMGITRKKNSYYIKKEMKKKEQNIKKS